jgi:hypothetical protein
LELRKTKRLGAPKNFQIVRPGEYGGFLKPQFTETTGNEDEAGEEEGLPVSNLPPFEPLVLWTDPNDPTNKVEVIGNLCSSLSLPSPNHFLLRFFRLFHNSLANSDLINEKEFNFFSNVPWGSVDLMVRDVFSRMIWVWERP